MVEFGSCFSQDKIEKISGKVAEAQKYIKMLAREEVELPQKIDCMTIEDIKEGEKLGGGHGEYISPDTIKINPFMDDLGILLNYIHENIHHVLPDASENLVDHLTDLVASQIKQESDRKYLPYGLTEEEKSDPVLLRKLSSCIEDVEKKSCPESALKPDGKYDYELCSANPIAICRHSLEKRKI